MAEGVTTALPRPKSIAKGSTNRRGTDMKLPGKHEQKPSPPAAQPTEALRPAKPPWHDLLDPQERPNREDLAAGHNVFTDSLLEPVPLPRWLRGRRRPPRDKLS